MKIVRYRDDGREHYGALEGDTVVPMEGSLDALTKTPSAKSIPLETVRLLAPVAPGKIVAAGLNYGEFVREQKVDPPAEPLIFLKPSTAVIGPNDAIIYPRQTRELYYEGELAIVIARKASRVPPSDARRYVLGYTCMNDVTAGDLQARDHEFTRSKSFDTFAPLGPVIETAIENPDALHLTTKLNGKLRSRYQHVGSDLQMRFSAQLHLAYHDPAARRRNLNRHPARSRPNQARRRNRNRNRTNRNPDQ